MRIKVNENGIIKLYTVKECYVGLAYTGHCCHNRPFLALIFDVGCIFFYGDDDKENEKKALALQEELFKNGYLDLRIYNWKYK